MVYLLLFAVTISRVLTFGHLHTVSPDEYFYTLIGREILGALQDGGELRSIDALHPPLFAWLLAWFFNLARSQSIETARLLGTACNLVAVAVFYRTAQMHFKAARQALWATALFAFIPALWRDADRVWADNLALLLACLAVYMIYLALVRKRSRYWLGAFAALTAMMLVKEYLVLLFLPPFAVALVLLARRERRLGMALSLGVAMLLMPALGVLWQERWAAWPQAGYLRQMLSPALLSQRSSYLGVGAPDLRKLYIQNLSHRDFPWAFLLLPIVLFLGRCLRKTGRSFSDRSSMAGIYLFHLTLIAVFFLYFSMLSRQYGSRLLFPALPSIALVVTAAFFSVRERWLVLPYAVLFLIYSAWSSSMQNTLQTAVSLGLGVLLILYIVLKAGDRRIGMVNMMTGLVLGAFLLNSALLIYEDSGRRAGQSARYGPLYGADTAVGWLKEELRPGDKFLTFNPRQAAYLLDISYRQSLAIPWWDIDDPLAQISREYMAERDIRYLLVTRPEGAEAVRRGLIDELRGRPWLKEAYLERNRRGDVVAAVFRWR